jgi:hypothetical protein
MVKLGLCRDCSSREVIVNFHKSRHKVAYIPTKGVYYIR